MGQQGAFHVLCGPGYCTAEGRIGCCQRREPSTINLFGAFAREVCDNQSLSLNHYFCSLLHIATLRRYGQAQVAVGKLQFSQNKQDSHQNDRLLKETADRTTPKFFVTGARKQNISHERRELFKIR